MINWIAYILIVTGMGLRILAMLTLKQNFSGCIYRMPKQIIITGIYRWIRHPSYLGSLLVIGGVTMLSIPGGIMYLAYAFYMARINEEERFLEAHFPEYYDYKKRTGKFIPRIHYGSGNTD